MKITAGSRTPPGAGVVSNDPVPEYDIGQRVELFADFVDDDGDAADPSLVTLQIINPEGDLSSVSPSNPAVGSYTYELDVPKTALSAGVWTFRFEGTGTVVAADERRFEVASSEFYTS